MNRELALLMTWGIVFAGMAPATISAEISVGVKEGDWIEYKITYTGTPPEERLTGIEIEILGVQGKSVTISGVLKASDGTQKTDTKTIDLETGQIEGGFIIPANLTKGNTFFEQIEGNITISGVEERTYAGGRRRVVYATVSNGAFWWDKTTGVLVEQSTSLDNYTVTMKADKTNIWPAEFWLPIDPNLFSILIAAAIMVAAVALVMIRRRKKPVARTRRLRSARALLFCYVS